MEITSTFTFCDMCNLSHEIGPLSSYSGTFAEAESVGWTEQDFGHCCPDCSDQLVEDPDVEHGATSLGEVLNSVRMPDYGDCIRCDGTGFDGGDPRLGECVVCEGSGDLPNDGIDSNSV